MESFGKAIIKILCGIIMITVLGIAVILLYAKIQPDIKIPYKEKTGEDVSGNLIENVEETEEDQTTEFITDYETDTMPVKTKSTVEEAYMYILDKYDLRKSNLTFYNEMEIQGNRYYGFQITDAGGGGWDQLLVYNVYNGSCYMYDTNDHLYAIAEDEFDTLNDYAYKSDGIISDDAWDEVIEKYLTAMLHDKNRTAMTALTDTSYYYDSKVYPDSKLERTEAVIRLNENKGLQIADTIKNRLSQAGISDYGVGYYILEKRDFTDELNAPWKDVMVGVITTYNWNGEWINEHVGDMRLTLRKYPDGWKVFWVEV